MTMEEVVRYSRRFWNPNNAIMEGNSSRPIVMEGYEDSKRVIDASNDNVYIYLLVDKTKRKNPPWYA